MTLSEIIKGAFRGTFKVARYSFQQFELLWTVEDFHNYSLRCTRVYLLEEHKIFRDYAKGFVQHALRLALLSMIAIFIANSFGALTLNLTALGPLVAIGWGLGLGLSLAVFLYTKENLFCSKLVNLVLNLVLLGLSIAASAYFLGGFLGCTMGWAAYLLSDAVLMYHFFDFLLRGNILDVERKYKTTVLAGFVNRTLFVTTCSLLAANLLAITPVLAFSYGFLAVVGCTWFYEILKMQASFLSLKFNRSTNSINVARNLFNEGKSFRGFCKNLTKRYFGLFTVLTIWPFFLEDFAYAKEYRFAPYARFVRTPLAGVYAFTVLGLTMPWLPFAWTTLWIVGASLGLGANIAESIRLRWLVDTSEAPRGNQVHDEHDSKQNHDMPGVPRAYLSMSSSMGAFDPGQLYDPVSSKEEVSNVPKKETAGNTIR